MVLVVLDMTGSIEAHFAWCRFIWLMVVHALAEGRVLASIHAGDPGRQPGENTQSGTAF
jgi:hypothetical protein